MGDHKLCELSPVDPDCFVSGTLDFGWYHGDEMRQVDTDTEALQGRDGAGVAISRLIS